MGRYKKGEWSGTKQKILMLHVEGRTQKEIAEEVGLSACSTVNKHIHGEEFQKRKAKLEGEIQEKVRDLFAAKGKDAAWKLIEIMEKGKPEDRIKFDAAKEILYQIGCKPVEVIETRGRDYSPDEVKSAMLVVKEMETISNRLSSTRSKFVLDKVVEGTPAPAPCQSTEEHKKEENLGQESTELPGND
jgi:predicted transcriptional regulator